MQSETGAMVSAEERESFRAHGFVVKPNLLSTAERDEVAAALEDACARIVAAAASVGKQEVFDGAAAFSVVDELGVRNLVWEGQSLDVVKVAEPITQVDERLTRLWEHPVLVELAKMALGVDAVAPFTDKFNAKRAGTGGEFLWHQDLPFWYSIIRTNARDTVTIGVFVNAATEANGALVVVPGTQTGPLPRRLTEAEVMLRYHADDTRIDTTGAIVAEVPAGGALVFGPYLLHRSGANTTERDRRVLLLTFQPDGRQRLSDFDYEPALLAEQWMDELP